MILVVGLALVGAISGAMIARKRNGSKADMAQYAAGYGIAFALAGLVLSLILFRLTV
ncbi:MAG: hypothetical protein ACR2O2_04855 [Ruegeria sp.]